MVLLIFHRLRDRNMPEAKAGQKKKDENQHDFLEKAS